MLYELLGKAIYIAAMPNPFGVYYVIRTAREGYIAAMPNPFSVYLSQLCLIHLVYMFVANK